MITDLGLSRLTNHSKSLLTKGYISEDNNALDPTDITVAQEILTKTLSDINSSGKTYTSLLNITTLEAIGDDIYRVGIKTESDNLFSISIHPLIVKTGNEEITYFFRIIVDRA